MWIDLIHMDEFWFKQLEPTGWIVWNFMDDSSN
jgi:hypothetical protein